jgi:5-methyltetrahydrofolate--homocysteine methyltransferase
MMADDNLSFATERLVNMIGGCCGSTPPHIAAIAAACAPCPPRPLPPKVGELQSTHRTQYDLTPHKVTPFMWLSGLEDLVVTKERFRFLNVGERCNLAGSIQFKKLIMTGDYQAAMDVAKKQVRLMYGIIMGQG